MTGVTKPSATSRSCTLCHQRKVRCDKKYPCANCSRAGVACSYPSSNAPVSRRPKSTIADIAGRLQQLERTIVSLSSPSTMPSTGDTVVVRVSENPAAPCQTSSSSTAQPPKQPQSSHVRAKKSTTGSSHGSPSENRRGEFRGVLVNSGDSSQYVNEILLSRVLEEDDETQSSTSSKSQSPPPGPPTALSTPIGYPFPPSTSTSPHDINTALPNPTLDLLPTRSQVSRLWSGFTLGCQNIIELLHLPTTQITIFTAIENPASASPDTLALLYAMSFCSLTIMWPDEARSTMGGTMSKPESLARMKTGFEASLARANIMERPTVIGLQSMALFLQGIRCHRVSRSDWVFLGLAIRLAQSIGVHRDGRHFPKLSVFEREIRRRLWWQLHAHDVRAAEDHGFAVGTGGDTSSYGSDADVPLHIDDGALYPGMKDLPEAKEGFTKMTHGLIMVNAAEACKGLSRALGSGGGEKARKKVVREMNDSVRFMMGWFSPVVPEQKACLVGCQIVLGKRDFVSRVQLLSRHGPNDDDDDEDGDDELVSGEEGEVEDGGGNEGREGNSGPLSHDTPQRRKLMEESLVIACDLLDLEHQYCEDDVLRDFIWLAEAYPQYHLLLYVLWHLTIRPEGPTVERAWRAVQNSFDHEAMRAWRQGSGEEPFSPKTYKHTGHKWAMFAKLRDKALRVKAAYGAKADGSELRMGSTSRDPRAAGEATGRINQVATEHAGTRSDFEAAIDRGQHSQMDGVLYETAAPEFLQGRAEVDDWNALLAEFTTAQDYAF